MKAHVSREVKMDRGGTDNRDNIVRTSNGDDLIRSYEPGEELLGHKFQWNVSGGQPYFLTWNIRAGVLFRLANRLSRL